MIFSRDDLQFRFHQRPNRNEGAVFVREPTYMYKASRRAFPRGNLQCAVRLQKKKKTLKNNEKRKKRKPQVKHRNKENVPEIVGAVIPRRNGTKKSRAHAKRVNSRRCSAEHLPPLRAELCHAATQCKESKCHRPHSVSSEVLQQQQQRYQVLRRDAIYYVIACEWVVVTGQMPSNHQI